MVEQTQPVATNKNHPCTDEVQQVPDAAPDDMIDLPSEFKRWPFLHELRDDCRDSLLAFYFESDSAAQHAQRDHKTWVLVAAGCATVAVCSAIVQGSVFAKVLLDGHQRAVAIWSRVLTVLPVIELVFVLAAWGAFKKGQKVRETWLTERHKAERCRLLKFKSMIHPGLWTLDELPPEQRPPELSNEINCVRGMSYPAVGTWLDDDKAPSPPGRILPHNLKQLTQLRDYYREKRLQSQSTYFKNPPERDVRWDELLRTMPYRLFKISVLFVFVHASISVVTEISSLKAIRWINWLESRPGFLHRAEVLSDAFIVLAAIFPVLGSGIRTYTSAKEAIRNISRFQAKSVALDAIDKRLGRCEITETGEAESVLRDLWCAEQIMESEHREWLRLMGGADWRG
jgi:hypothetical protein